MKQYVMDGRTFEEADEAALQAAVAFRDRLVKYGLLTKDMSATCSANEKRTQFNNRDDWDVEPDGQGAAGGIGDFDRARLRTKWRGMLMQRSSRQSKFSATQAGAGKIVSQTVATNRRIIANTSKRRNEVIWRTEETVTVRNSMDCWAFGEAATCNGMFNSHILQKTQKTDTRTLAICDSAMGGGSPKGADMKAASSAGSRCSAAGRFRLPTGPSVVKRPRLSGTAAGGASSQGQAFAQAVQATWKAHQGIHIPAGQMCPSPLLSTPAGGIERERSRSVDMEEEEPSPLVRAARSSSQSAFPSRPALEPQAALAGPYGSKRLRPVRRTSPAAASAASSSSAAASAGRPARAQLCLENKPSRQSGVPNVVWLEQEHSWRVEYRDNKITRGKTFPIHRYAVRDRTFDEATEAALQEAIAFREDLVEQGIVKEEEEEDLNCRAPRQHCRPSAPRAAEDLSALAYQVANTFREDYAKRGPDAIATPLQRVVVPRGEHPEVLDDGADGAEVEHFDPRGRGGLPPKVERGALRGRPVECLVPRGRQPAVAERARQPPDAPRHAISRAGPSSEVEYVTPRRAQLTALAFSDQRQGHAEQSQGSAPVSRQCSPRRRRSYGNAAPIRDRPSADDDCILTISESPAKVRRASPPSRNLADAERIADKGSQPVLFVEPVAPRGRQLAGEERVGSRESRLAQVDAVVPRSRRRVEAESAAPSCRQLPGVACTVPRAGQFARVDYAVSTAGRELAEADDDESQWGSPADVECIDLEM